jgi:hypothetical protein
MGGGLLPPMPPRRPIAINPFKNMGSIRPLPMAHWRENFYGHAPSWILIYTERQGGGVQSTRKGFNEESKINEQPEK